MDSNLCYYCKTPTNIQCSECHTSFCNAKGESTAAHLVFHLAQNHHKRVSFHGLPLECTVCKDDVVFNLGVCDKSKIFNKSEQSGFIEKLDPGQKGQSAVSFDNKQNEQFLANKNNGHEKKEFGVAVTDLKDSLDTVLSSKNKQKIMDLLEISGNAAPVNPNPIFDLNTGSEPDQTSDIARRSIDSSILGDNSSIQTSLDHESNDLGSSFVQPNSFSPSLGNSNEFKTALGEPCGKPIYRKHDHVFMCRGCAKSLDWIPLVVERSLRPEIFGGDECSPLTQANLARLEAQYAPLKVRPQLRYTLEEYQQTYSTLVEAECAAERAYKESLGLSSVFVNFSECTGSSDAEARAAAYLSSIGIEAAAEPVRPSKLLFCSLNVPNVDSRVSVGDELLLMNEQTRVKAYIVANSTNNDQIRARVFRISGEYPKPGNYSLEYVYKDVGRSRMLLALKKMSRMCPKLLQHILGLPNTDQESEKADTGNRIDMVQTSKLQTRINIQEVSKDIASPVSHQPFNDIEKGAKANQDRISDLFDSFRIENEKLMGTCSASNKFDERVSSQTLYARNPENGTFMPPNSLAQCNLDSNTQNINLHRKTSSQSRADSSDNFADSLGSSMAQASNRLSSMRSAEDSVNNVVQMETNKVTVLNADTNISRACLKSIKIFDTSKIKDPPNLPALNTSQRGAVAAALSQPLTLIQGPPGTGKTVTSAATVYNLVKSGHRVLVCSSANTAIDNLARKLHQTGLRVVRIVSKRREGVTDELSFLSLHVQANILLRETQKARNDIAFDNQENHNLSEQFENDNLLKNKKSQITPSDLLELQNSGNVIDPPAQDKKSKKNNKLSKASKGSVCDQGGSSVDSDHFYSGDSDSVKSHSKQDKMTKENKRLQDKCMKKILSHAEVVACTCITAGHWILRHMSFSAVLIDEAVQCTEPLSIIPLVFNCAKLILVGDHKQLGPIILDKRAARAGLKQTLFERLIKLGNTPYLLNTQYRMHPRMAEWPSNAFYDGSLKSGISEAKRFTRIPLPLPTFFYACYGTEEVSESGTSYLNQGEAALIESTIKLLLRNNVRTSQIGVITPYEGQRAHLTQRLQSQMNINDLEIRNVDAFQGREKDFIVVSLVRSNVSQGIGFLNDKRRLNVTLTRAKFGCIIIGNPNTLSRDKTWNDLIRFYQDRDMIFRGPLEALQKINVIKKSTAIDLRALFDKIQL